MTTPLLQEVKAPFFLRELPIWLVWRYEDNKNGKKPLKVPYYINGQRRHGKQGSLEDIAQLGTFNAAKEFAMDHDYTGLGVAILPGYNITGVDFDNVVSDGILNPEVACTLCGTYVEYSPSGKGIHAFVLGELGNNKDTAKDGKYGVELFSSKGFLTFTGDVTELTELTDCSNAIVPPSGALQDLIVARFGAIKEATDVPHEQQNNLLGLSHEQIAHALNHLSPDCDYHEWLQIGMGIHHETNGEGFVLWDTWSANSPEKYSSEEYNRTKWDSFGGSTRPVTARSLLKLANSHGAGLITERVSEDDFEPIREIDEPVTRDLAPIPWEGTNTDVGLYVPVTTNSLYFKIRSASEFISTVKPITWLIKGFLPKATLGVLYGESGSGKSFVALDICASLGRGVEWNGIQHRGGNSRVLYVAAEGVGGFAHRLGAYCRQAGITIDDLPIDIISDVTPNLMDGLSVNHLIKDITQKGRYDLIIMDTFAQVTPGANENSGEDMGKALGYCRKISQSSDAMVLLIHHSGKDASKGARGWSGVHAACDVVLEVTRFDNERCIKVTKQKDGIDGAEFGFSLLPVVLGEDADGDDISSCIVDYHPFVKPVKELKTHQKVVYDVLSEFSPESWATVNNVIELCLERIPKEDGVRDIRKQNVKRAITNGLGVFIEQDDNGSIRASRK